MEEEQQTHHVNPDLDDTQAFGFSAPTPGSSTPPVAPAQQPTPVDSIELNWAVISNLDAEVELPFHHDVKNEKWKILEKKMKNHKLILLKLSEKKKMQMRLQKGTKGIMVFIPQEMSQGRMDLELALKDQGGVAQALLQSMWHQAKQPLKQRALEKEEANTLFCAQLAGVLGQTMVARGRPLLKKGTRMEMMKMGRQRASSRLDPCCNASILAEQPLKKRALEKEGANASSGVNCIPFIHVFRSVLTLLVCSGKPWLQEETPVQESNNDGNDEDGE
eukprot:6491145-Amphidinium_carterae.1